MKILHVIFLLFVSCSIIWAQKQIDNVNKVADDYKQPINEKINDDNTNNFINKEKNETELKSNKINMQQSSQKIVPQKVENINADNKNEKKSFGSALNSGPEIKLTKQSNQSEISNTELGKNLNNPKKMKK